MKLMGVGAKVIQLGRALDPTPAITVVHDRLQEHLVLEAQAAEGAAADPFEAE
jgi:hypothetical protein